MSDEQSSGYRVGDYIFFGPSHTPFVIKEFVTEPDVAVRQMKYIKLAEHSDNEPGPFDFGGYEDGTLDRVIKTLLKLRASIPREFRAKAQCTISSESCADVDIFYRRPETDIEVHDRLAKLDYDKRAREAQIEAAERMQYERLKAKFGATE